MRRCFIVFDLCLDLTWTFKLVEYFFIYNLNNDFIKTDDGKIKKKGLLIGVKGLETLEKEGGGDKHGITKKYNGIE